MEQLLVKQKPPKQPFSSPNSNFYFLDNIHTGKVIKIYHQNLTFEQKNDLINKSLELEKREYNQRKRIRKIREKYNKLGEKKEKKKKIKLSDFQKIENLYNRIGNCGTEKTEFINSVTSEFYEMPIYCNNRACSNKGCMEHRGYLFNRNHINQIQKLDENIRKPKGWIFTGWKQPLEKISREFLQEKLRYLNKLCKTFSVSAYSIHLEIKIYKDNAMGYIHFHVVSGGFRQIRILIKKWGRVVKYEDAIKKNSLNYYVSKYASKTPFFNTDFKREKYHILVYKLQMHRFSIKKDNSLSNRESDYVNLDVLALEVRSILKRDSYLNPLSDKKRYHALLEKPPPNKNKEILEVIS